MDLVADPSLSDALSLLGQSTIASQEIQSAIHKRLEETTMPYLHHTSLHLPHSIAHLLFHDPHLVSYAVKAFYTRDPLSLKACQKMPSFKPTNYVPMTVTLTRTMYAQLTSQTFTPPSKQEFPEIKSTEDDVSMKLVCGFEMLVVDPYWTGILKGGTTEAKEWDFERDAGWKAFEERLKALSYYHVRISSY